MFGRRSNANKVKTYILKDSEGNTTEFVHDGSAEDQRNLELLKSRGWEVVEVK